LPVEEVVAPCVVVVDPPVLPVLLALDEDWWLQAVFVHNMPGRMVASSQFRTFMV
jgi:hypothetical protein